MEMRSTKIDLAWVGTNVPSTFALWYGKHAVDMDYHECLGRTIHMPGEKTKFTDALVASLFLQTDSEWLYYMYPEGMHEHSMSPMQAWEYASDMQQGYLRGTGFTLLSEEYLVGISLSELTL